MSAVRVAIIGSGPAGLSAAARAAALGLSHVLIEKTGHLSDTIWNYQHGKHVMATPPQLVLRAGRSADVVAAVAREAGASAVHALRHYEPWWRDAEAALSTRLDLVLHDGTRLLPPDRVRTGSGGRYRIFTPYWRALAQQLPPARPARVPKLSGTTMQLPSDSLADWNLLPNAPDWAGGFDLWQPGEAGAQAALDRFGAAEVRDYAADRNLPSKQGSSGLSPHLHFGEVSPAQVWHHADHGKAAEPFLRELAWRDFTANQMEILPDIGDANGRPAMDALPWRSSKADFRAWTRGRTGYPIVDAGMRQLWHIGWMHNRVRMITASFLIKHLLIDWREGERWFWDTLVDADYGNNSVNWQWVAGTGVDSSPFSRIMAPLTQSPKFQAADYIREWVPELRGLPDATIHDPHGEGVAPEEYPKPLIGHREGRERALAAARQVRA